MARSDEQNRIARERSREVILQAAIESFAERGVSGASIAEITQRAGVAQGLVSYHFGGKDQLISAVIDRWFEMLFGIPQAEGHADVRLAGIIDGALTSTGFTLPVQRAVFSMQQQPSTHRLYAAAEDRHVEQAIAAENTVREIFRERGAADPPVEEIMLRTTLEGIFMKYAVYGDSYPLEDARRWVHRIYGLPEPEAPLPLPLAPSRPGCEDSRVARAPLDRLTRTTQKIPDAAVLASGIFCLRSCGLRGVSAQRADSSQLHPGERAEDDALGLHEVALELGGTGLCPPREEGVEHRAVLSDERLMERSRIVDLQECQSQLGRQVAVGPRKARTVGQ